MYEICCYLDKGIRVFMDKDMSIVIRDTLDHNYEVSLFCSDRLQIKAVCSETYTNYKKGNNYDRKHVLRYWLLRAIEFSQERLYVVTGAA